MKNLVGAAPLLAILLVSSLAMADDSPAAPAAPAAPVEATVVKQEAPAAEKKADELPESVAMLTGGSTGAKQGTFGILAVVDQSLGIGTFVSDTYARNPYYGYNISIRPKYNLTDKLFAELRFDLVGELTNSYSTNTTYKRQVMPSDLFLTFKYQNAYKIPVLDIGISPFIRLGAPTSYESRYRDLYLSLAAGLDLSRMFGSHFFMGYTLRANKNFNGSTTARLGSDVALVRTKGAEDAGGGFVFAGEDNNIEWSILNALLLSYIVNDQWSISLQLSIKNGWTYSHFPLDQNSGAGAKAGRGQRDETIGMLDVTYQPWEHFGFSLGLSSKQPAKTADNKSFRFPFFDFSSAGNNYTNIYFDVFMTY